MPEKIKRLRVLAGPNGSGKSTVVFHILQNYHCGTFINADELHKVLQSKKAIDLALYSISDGSGALDHFLSTTGKSWVEKAAKEGKPIRLTCKDNHLCVDEFPGDYDAAIAADFLRYQLVQQEGTFTFETVLSDGRKVDFLQEAKKAGFKIYLYFVCTQDPKINKIRVANRVAKGGHDVPTATIERRYYASLQVLPNLIPLTHRCFLFDNSVEGDKGAINLVAEIEQGTKLIIKSEEVPQWVQEHVLEPLFL